MSVSAGPVRCPWGDGDDLYRRYHDQEWGIPLRNAEKMFALLVLEGMQAGLSWRTILGKREAIADALANLRPEPLAAVPDERLLDLLQTAPGSIIRSRAKLFAARNNARAFMKLAEREDPVPWLWQFVEGAPVTNHFEFMHEVPSSTKESAQMAMSLKKLGFSFVGPTICYAYMQSAGMVNDHLISCFRHEACRAAASVSKRLVLEAPTG